MKTACRNCGGSMEGKRGDAKFCCLECKNEFNYRQKNGLEGTSENRTNPLDLTFRDRVTLSPEKEESQSRYDTLKSKETNVDADFLSSLIQDNIIQVGKKKDDNNKSDDLGQENEADQSKTDLLQPDRFLPEKYITQKVQKPNITYRFYEIQLRTSKEKKEALEREFKNLSAELENQNNRTGNGYIWTGAIGGALVALYNREESKTSKRTEKKDGEKNRKENSGFWGNLFNFAFCAAMGTGTGYLAKSFTEESREKNKVQRIAAVNKRLDEIRLEYKEIGEGIANYTSKIATVPKMLDGIEQIPNPEYQKAKERQPIIHIGGNKPGLKDINQNSKKPIKFKSDKIIKASDVGKMEYQALNFQDLWREFFGQPEVNFHILIHGNSGEGKSTFCMRFAKYLAQNFGRVLYVTAEEGINMTFRDKLKYCKAEVDNFFILDVRTGDDFMNEIGVNEFHFIILDSLHDMDIDAEKMKIIFQRYKNSAFICIDQNNKKGDLLGANEKKHICDVVVNVKNYTAETTKNRFVPKGQIFKTEDFIKSGTKIISIGIKNNSDDCNLDSDRKNLV